MLVSEVHYPRDLLELLELMRRLPGALLYSGGTEILREQAGRGLMLPGEVICIHELPELRKTSLSERFLDVGAAVTLSELLELASSALPPLLADAVRGIGTPALRNLATIGGNLATRSRFMDAWPALACLDALVELRDAAGATWINVNRLCGEDGRPSFPEGGLLTRLRIPLERWDIFALRKIGGRDYPSPETAVFALAARAEKGILAAFRLAFAGQTALRLQDVESRILGRSLPLSERERTAFGQEYREAAAELPEALALQFGALVDGALDLLAR
ncbi:MAG TPA: FAD binding domain-containing protein [Rectinemataceae bacterium]|nr:FAD binding domain-containing protein [Rectinemataceae bacterium]